jgi:hypothetical protein
MANPPVRGDSATVGTPGVRGQNSAGGDGVYGEGRRGVVGHSDAFRGVDGSSTGNAGVYGESDNLHGVYGLCHNPNGGGVFGTNDRGGAGVIGSSPDGEGVHGETGSNEFKAGVIGVSTHPEGAAPGVLGQSRSGAGVVGRSDRDAGVKGFHGDPALQESTVSSDAGHAGVFGASDEGAGVLGYSRRAGAPAVHAFGDLRVNGNVDVGGDIFLPGADCAEHFDVADPDLAEPGTVLVIQHDGTLRDCTDAYDRKVAGVVSGAGAHRPGVVLDGQRRTATRRPVALVGKVYCKVDARYGAIDVGDLLTTSPTRGHAMKASDASKAFGAVIGKSLRALPSGTSLVPILISLQ